MKASGHQRIDQRSIALHRAVAEKLRARPELLDRARGNIGRWYPGAGAARPYLDQWLRILDQPLEEVLAAMVDDGEKMTALRQSSPFTGILEPAERWAIYRRFASRGSPRGSSE